MGLVLKKIQGSLVCGYQNVNRYTSIGSPNQIMVWKWDFCDQTSKSYQSFFWDQEKTNLVLLHFPFLWSGLHFHFNGSKLDPRQPNGTFLTASMDSENQFPNSIHFETKVQLLKIWRHVCELLRNLKEFMMNHLDYSINQVLHYKFYSDLRLTQ